MSPRESTSSSNAIAASLLSQCHTQFEITTWNASIHLINQKQKKKCCSLQQAD